ncbi:MAG: hypothetical protein ACRD0L_14890, partial [Acidimicrobiales bacterium]
TGALRAAYASAEDLGQVAARADHARRVDVEARTAAVVADRLGTPALDALRAGESWPGLVSAVTRVEEWGIDAPARLASADEALLARTEDLVAALSALSRTQAVGGREAPLIEGLLGAPGPAADPEVRAYVEELGQVVVRKRQTLAEALTRGPAPPAPPWAAALGPPPTDPEARRRWAQALSEVVTWREARVLSGADLIGPEPRGQPAAHAAWTRVRTALGVARMEAGRPSAPRPAMAASIAVGSDRPALRPSPRRGPTTGT